MAPVRVARAFRLPIIAAVAALAVSGCTHATDPLASVPPSDLDTLAYGQPYSSDAANAVLSRSAVADSGGGVSALRTSFAASPGASYARSAALKPAAHDYAYRLDAGDKLRVVVYGEASLTNVYAIDGGGAITMPLIGAVRARRRTPAGLAAEISAKLRNGYLRDPSVAVEVETYRPFFILGEVAAPGQYPYVPNMSVESAVAVAGGFAPGAKRDRVTLTHTDHSGSSRAVVPLGTPLSPGDTILVEGWF